MVQASKKKLKQHAPGDGKTDSAGSKPARTGKVRHGRLSGLFRNHQEVAVDSLDRLLASAGASALTWAMIAIAIALPLFLLLLLQNLRQFGSDIDEATQISLFLEIEITASEIQVLQDELSGRQELASVGLISPEQALAEFEQNSGFSDVLSGLDQNPLPPVLVLTPATQDIASVRVLVSELQDMPGVDDVQFDLDWLQRLYGILDLAGRLTLMLGMLLALGVTLVVGNTIRLAIENRRDEIVVVKLVGGTDSYVSRPFLYTGLWYGVGGGVIACVLVLMAQFAIRGPVSALAGLYDAGFDLIGLDLSDIFLVLVMSGLLGWFGAWLSVLRHLRAIEPR